MCGRLSTVYILVVAVVASFHQKTALSFCLRPSHKPLSASPMHERFLASSRLFVSAAASPSTTVKDVVLHLKDPPVKPFSPGPSKLMVFV
jgi:hypothetical protein